MTNAVIFMFSQVAQIHKGGVKVAVQKCGKVALLLLALPAVLIVILLRPWVLFRFGMLDGSRIGAFAGNTDAYLCWREQIKLPLRTIDIVGCPRRSCNSHLQKMWLRTGYFYASATICQILAKACQFWTASNLHTVKITTELWQQCTISHPHLKFEAAEHLRAKNLLTELGVPSGTPWICISNRDSGYLSSVLPPAANAPGGTWNYHDFRNFEVSSLQPAAEALTQRGYFVIRMGSYVTTPLITNNAMIIDYANHRVQSDFADVYLLANCRFSISADSGIFALAAIFGRPFAVVNAPWPLPYYKYYSWNTTPFLIKRFYHVQSTSFLTLREVFQAGLGTAGTSHEFEKAGVELINNTAAEISDLSIEVDSRLCGTWDCDPQDELLQQRLLKIIRLYSPQIIHGNLHARLGASFLRTHQYLLD